MVKNKPTSFIRVKVAVAYCAKIRLQCARYVGGISTAGQMSLSRLLWQTVISFGLTFLGGFVIGIRGDMVYGHT